MQTAYRAPRQLPASSIHATQHVTHARAGTLTGHHTVPFSIDTRASIRINCASSVGGQIRIRVELVVQERVRRCTAAGRALNTEVTHYVFVQRRWSASVWTACVRRHSDRFIRPETRNAPRGIVFAGTASRHDGHDRHQGQERGSHDFALGRLDWYAIRILKAKTLDDVFKKR